MRAVSLPDLSRMERPVQEQLREAYSSLMLKMEKATLPIELSRAYGVATMVVVHRLSDLTAAGDQGSEQVRLARGLLSDVETRVIYGQPPSEVQTARDLLGLSDVEADLLPRLPRGVALWKVGLRTFLVEHKLGRMERTIVDTDARMTLPTRE